MATTKNGIYYQDNYEESADVLADMKAMADSIEEKVITDVIKIKEEQIEQNVELEVLRDENERLRADIKGLGIESEPISGESIDLVDSADMRFSSFEIRGNSKQKDIPGEVECCGDNGNINIVVENEDKTQSQIFTIPTQQPMRSVENYGQEIRDMFINIGAKKVERHNIYRQILNGTENWSYDSSRKIFSWNSNIRAQTFSNLELPPPVYSSYYTMASWSDYPNANYNASVICYGWTYTAFRIRDDRFTTVEAFKAYLSEQYNSGTPVYFDYILATPTDIECTAEQIKVLDEIDKTIKSYKGVTHIYSTNNVGPNVKVTYFKDIDTMINNLNTALVALGGV